MKILEKKKVLDKIRRKKRQLPLPGLVKFFQEQGLTDKDGRPTELGVKALKES